MKQKTAVDCTQADMMLEFLEGLNEGKPVLNKLDSILNAEGTGLIVEQMNIVRKVSLGQYEQLLRGLADNQLPYIAPVDTTERAKRGIEGLTHDAWLVLNWGLNHTGLLRQRLTALKGADVYRNAESLAHRYLPAHVDISPSLFVVTGGRAGAAAIGGERIYIDILVMTYQRVRQNREPMNEAEATEYFAHEMHHIGFSKYLDSKFAGLSLDDNQRRLFGMVRSIVSEGSATYLISNHRDVDEMRRRFKLTEEPNKQKVLLRNCEELMRQLTEGDFATQDDYDKANTLMLGHGYHAVGSIMLSTIDQAGGLESVMNVLADPRTLLLEYNEAVKVLSDRDGADELHSFDSGLSKIVGEL